jgi:hypothetical protein
MNAAGVGRRGRWLGGSALLLLLVPWALVGPDVFFWSAFVAVGVAGSVIATAAVMSRRSDPSLTDLIQAALAQPVPVTAAAPRADAVRRPRGERNP